jgi:hypothetical protein
MRPLAPCILLALLTLPAMAASEPGASTASRLRSTNFRHDVLLRETDEEASTGRASFPLPPGGRELELQPTASTPYDRYFNSVRSVIANLEPHSATSMVKACHLMKVGHSFQYISRDPYRPDPPKLTEMQHSGDCKSKALWLYDNLADSGALFVIGKAEKSLSTSHAWVYWRSSGRWWILDCTDRADPIAADTVAPGRYVPYYSFGKFGTYRHPAGKLVADSATTTAASTAPVTSANARQKQR